MPLVVDNSRLTARAGRIAGCAWGAIVAWLVVSTTVDELFGWQRLAVVQIALSLPLAMTLAWLLRTSILVRAGISRAVAWCLVGALVAGGMIVALPAVATSLNDPAMNFAARTLARSLLCLALVLPWCLAGESVAAVLTETTPSTAGASRAANLWALSVAALVATALPAVYAADLCRRQTTLCTEGVNKQQLVVAQRILERLNAVASRRPVAGEAPRDLAKKMDAAIAQLTRRAAQQNRPSLDAAEAIELARVLAMLDRLDEAERILAPHRATNAQASLLSAAILQQQRHWGESSASYETAARLLNDAPASPETIAGRVRAINGIAYNAREAGQYAVAESAYLQGLASVPDAAAHFHFQLGRHYQLGGRPLQAVTHLRRAVELDPRTYQEQSAAVLQQLATESPSCVIGPWRNQTRDNSDPRANADMRETTR